MVDHRRQVPTNRTVLLPGRAGDIELKGLDIAAVAVAGIKVAHGKRGPVMLLRGSQVESECAGLHDELVRRSGLLDDLPRVFEYTHEVRCKLTGVLSWSAMAEALIARLGCLTG